MNDEMSLVVMTPALISLTTALKNAFTNVFASASMKRQQELSPLSATYVELAGRSITRPDFGSGVKTVCQFDFAVLQNAARCDASISVVCDELVDHVDGEKSGPRTV